jgi:hypothetical protein
MRRSLFLGLTVAMAFWVGSVSAQEVPVFENGQWLLPEPESVGMGPDMAQEPAAVQGGGYEAAIYDACAQYGCDGNQLVRVMYCESGGDHGAVGPNGERGIFQFHPNGEWPYAANYGPYEQIDLAAQLFAQGYAGSWVCQ